MTFYEGMRGLFELAIISVKNCEFTVTSDVELKDDRSQVSSLLRVDPLRWMDDLHEGRKARLRAQFFCSGAIQSDIQ